MYRYFSLSQSENLLQHLSIMKETKLLQNCVKNDPCDVIKMREMRGEVGKKTLKKEMDNPLFS